MRSRVSPVLAFTLPLLLAAATAWPACDGCKYAHRGDRFEGIGVRQVSGGSFDLLGVEVRPPSLPAPAGDQVHLYFWLPGTETPAIEVWEPGSNYWMVPDKKSYGAGLQDYAWPRREVLGPSGVELVGLHAKVRNHDETVYFPALVSTAPKAPAGGVYSFVFKSGAGVDVKCQISRSAEGRIVPVRQFRFNEDSGGTLRIEWDGKDDQGQPVPAGIYVLRIKGEMLAETLRPLTLNLTFLHHG
ncbi:MAG TPA: hypothetical protein VFE33_08180 [Thermoanaerobaculia bacterium]|nr:hypothetical protein [Thermoanaerobaculia bacterium]